MFIRKSFVGVALTVLALVGCKTNLSKKGGSDLKKVVSYDTKDGKGVVLVPEGGKIVGWLCTPRGGWDGLTLDNLPEKCPKPSKEFTKVFSTDEFVKTVAGVFSVGTFETKDHKDLQDAKNNLEEHKRNLAYFKAKLSLVEMFVSNDKITDAIASEFENIKMRLNKLETKDQLTVLGREFDDFLNRLMGQIIREDRLYVYSASNPAEKPVANLLKVLLSPRHTRLTKYFSGTHSYVSALQPAVLPDGRIVYRTDRSKRGTFEIWLLDPNEPEGSERRQIPLTKYHNLTHDKNDSRNPAVLPDGRIMYTRTESAGPELWLLDLNEPEDSEKRQIRLTKYNANYGYVGYNKFAVLPDGRIVYPSDNPESGGMDRQLWLLNLNEPEGSEKRQIRLTKHNETHAHVSAMDPAVLPDGRIVYSTNRTESGVYELWLLDLNEPEGSEKRQIRLTKYNDTDDYVSSASQPAVLPDGRIVYRAYVIKKNQQHQHELWLLDPKEPKGSEKRQITLTRHNVLDPAVLPDGRIVYSTDRSKNGVYELWILDPSVPE